MRSATLALAVLLLLGAPGLAGAFNPHEMVDADGDIDMSTCGSCHEDDAEMTLLEPSGEICISCHMPDSHSGAVVHLDARAAQVARLAGPERKEAAELPLTDEGRIYCGTCHLFHDPALSDDEKLLPQPWLPARTGLAGAVERSLVRQWLDVERRYGISPPVAELDRTGTTWLRRPVHDGALCRACHGDMKNGDMKR